MAFARPMRRGNSELQYARNVPRLVTGRSQQRRMSVAMRRVEDVAYERLATAQVGMRPAPRSRAAHAAYDSTGRIPASALPDLGMPITE